jgi:hypothetical protein
MKYPYNILDLPLIPPDRRRTINPYLPNTTKQQFKKPSTAVEKFIESRKLKLKIKTLDGLDPKPYAKGALPDKLFNDGTNSIMEIAQKLPQIEWVNQYKKRAIPSTPQSKFFNNVIEHTDHFFFFQTPKEIFAGQERKIKKEKSRLNAAIAETERLESLQNDKRIVADRSSLFTNKRAYPNSSSRMIAMESIDSMDNKDEEDTSLHERYINCIINEYSKNQLMNRYHNIWCKKGSHMRL